MCGISKAAISGATAVSNDDQAMERKMLSTIASVRQGALKECVADDDERGTFYEFFGLRPFSQIDGESRAAIHTAFEAACDVAQRFAADPSHACDSSTCSNGPSRFASSVCMTPGRRAQADLCTLAVARQVLLHSDLKRRYDLELIRRKDQNYGKKEWYCFQVGHWLLFCTGVVTVVVGIVATSGAGAVVLGFAGNALLTAAVRGRGLLDYDPDCSMLEYGRHMILGALQGLVGSFFATTIGLAPVTAPFIVQYVQAVALGASIYGTGEALTDASDVLISGGYLGQAVKDNVCSFRTADEIFSLENLWYFLSVSFSGPLFAHLVPRPKKQQQAVGDQSDSEVEQVSADADAIDGLCICGTCRAGQLGSVGNCEEECLKRSQSLRLALRSRCCPSPHVAPPAGSDAWSATTWLRYMSYIKELVSALSELMQEERQAVEPSVHIRDLSKPAHDHLCGRIFPPPCIHDRP